MLKTREISLGIKENGLTTGSSTISSCVKRTGYSHQAPDDKTKAYQILKELFENTSVSIGRGAKHHLHNRCTVLDIWKCVNGGTFNIACDFTIRRNNELTIRIYQHDGEPISFDGVAVVLLPSANFRGQSFNRTSSPYEEKLELSNVPNEYRVRFAMLELGSYKLKAGDPYLNAYGNPRR